MITPAGHWLPDLFPKQFEILNCYQPYVLVTGPRWSAKTVGCLNRLARHAWELPVPGRVLMLPPTVKNAVEGGIWSQMIEQVIPAWMDGGVGMRYMVTPRIHGSTRMHHFTISNHFKRPVQFQLGSLDYDYDVERILKGKEYSAIYLPELDNFKDRIVFDASIQQLRMPGVPENMLLWLADTNPAEEGTDSWIWKLFYEERLRADHPNPDFQKKLHLIETVLDDNLSLSEKKKSEILGSFAYSPDLLARYGHGKWTASSKNSHFHDVFHYDTHVIGGPEIKYDEPWKQVVLQAGCSTLVSGWDLGTSRNHSSHIIEPVRLASEKMGYIVLDELVEVGKMVSLEDFTDAYMRRREEWEKLTELTPPQKLDWRDWSDNSAFVFRSLSERAAAFDHIQVMRASDGKVKLHAAPKFPGSRAKRVDLVRRLLFENRLWIWSHCKHTIEMLRILRKGRTQSEYLSPAHMVHAFDSLSYALIAECADEVSNFYEPTTSRPESSLVTTSV